MKYFAFVFLAFSGCATVSDYNLGCRDGVRAWVDEVQHAGVEESVLVKGCGNLEAARKSPKENRDGPSKAR